MIRIAIFRKNGNNYEHYIPKCVIIVHQFSMQKTKFLFKHLFVSSHTDVDQLGGVERPIILCFVLRFMMIGSKLFDVALLYKLMYSFTNTIEIMLLKSKVIIQPQASNKIAKCTKHRLRSCLPKKFRIMLLLLYHNFISKAIDIIFLG